MADNTKQRSEEIQQAAAGLLAEMAVDVSERVAIRPLAKLLAERVNCHYTTAKNHVAQAVRRARGELVKVNWGGPREGAGYPKGEPRMRKIMVGLARQDMAEFLNDNQDWMEQYRAELEQRLRQNGYDATVEISSVLSDKITADDQDQARQDVDAVMARMGNELDDWLKQ